MKTPSHRSRRGYTIAEVLVAAGLLGIMIGSAVSLVGTMNTVETASRSTSVATNILDCAAQLWQLGLSPAEARAVLPITTNNEILSRTVVADGSGNTVTYGTAGTTALANSMGTVENIAVSVVSQDPQGSSNRTLTATVYRPTSR
jgi:type II secretory pathway pseudopilin PulG